MSDQQQVEMNRLPATERYNRDPAFHHLVTVLESMIWKADYTPTELREAVILAAMRVNNVRPAAPCVFTKEQYDAFMSGPWAATR